MHRLGYYAVPLVVGAAFLSCVSPLAPATLVPVATVVELTLQALTAAPPFPGEASAPAPSATPTDLLPRDLYFIDRDIGGLRQVFRIDADGHTLHQITFEPVDVDDYDVSTDEGLVAYISNNQLYLVDAAGAGRRLLLDGGPVDENNRWTNSVLSPVWSPDGKTLAFSHGGLSFLDLNTGTSSKVLDNQIDNSPGFPIVREIFAPNRYSADGVRLLIDIGYYESGIYAIYLPSNNAVIRFTRQDGGSLCCYADWLPDGSGVYITSPSIGLIDSGLYYADVATGVVNTLLPATASDGTYNFAWSTQVGPDSNLYFFYNNLTGIPTEGHTPLYLVRSAADGVTDRVKLLPDPIHNINEVLWAPDASLVVVVIAPDSKTYAGGEPRIIYPDGRPGFVLTPWAQDLRWGP